MSGSARERELALIQAAGSTQSAVILTAIWEAVIYTVTAAILGTAATVIGGVIIAAKLGLSFPVISFSTLALIAAGGFILILAATVAPTIAALRREITRTLAGEGGPNQASPKLLFSRGTSRQNAFTGVALRE